MAVTYIVNALGGTATTTSFSITLPATAAGDILILEFCHRGTGNGTIGGTYTGPAFTLKHSQLFGASAFSGKTYWSRATGNHTGETVTGSSLINSCAAILTVYRGALASGDPLADATIVGEENAAADETQAQITTATNGSWVVLVVVNSPDLAVSTQACTSPTLTEKAERLSTGGTDSSIAHASGEKATAGGTGAFTWAQTDAASGSWAYAIKPEPPATNPTISSASMADADRDWDAPFQDIAITFSESVDITPAPSVGDTVAGLTADISGGTQGATLTYRSGNATASWKVRLPELMHQNNSVVLDYAQASGSILAVDDNAELAETVNKVVTNNLTKRVRAILKDKNNALVASEILKCSVHEYDSNNPLNANWMLRSDKSIPTTTAAGVLDVPYTGTASVGATVFLVVIRPHTGPTESMVWSQAVE